MEQLKPIELNYKSLDGISERQISEHFDVLYKGYVTKVNEIREKLQSASKEAVNGTYADYRELRLEESFALDAVKLHEAYFVGLGGDGTPTERVKKWLEKDFGSFDNWVEHMKATALGARGWAVTYYDYNTKELAISLSDFHSHGAIWNTEPIVVLDTYEHAYFMDFGTKRKDYLDKYFENLSFEAYADKILENIEKIVGV